MKIGILTQTPSYNFGGTLQCLALQRVLENMGHEVEVISYRSNNRGRRLAKVKLLFAGVKLSEILSTFADKIRNSVNSKTHRTRPLPPEMINKNLSFIEKYINLTESCDEDSIGELVQKHQYDAIVFGSDKIWGDLGMSQLVYFGDWCPTPKCKLFSYAACSGKLSIPSFNRRKIENCLKRFDKISVRDEQTRDLFSSLYNTEISIVSDPTLLYDFNEFKNGEIIDSPYILTYILGREIKGGHKEMINQIRKKNPSCIIVSIVITTESTDIVRYSDKVIYDASPDEWVSLFFHASFIYTDSYHGTLFALKFRKTFVSYYKELLRSSRLIDIKRCFSLHNVINDVCEYTDDDVTNYVDIENKIDELNKISLAYLKDVLIMGR